MRQKKCLGALHGEENRGGENTERDKDRGNRFSFAVTIRMSFIGRSRRETRPSNEGGSHEEKPRTVRTCRA